MKEKTPLRSEARHFGERERPRLLSSAPSPKTSKTNRAAHIFRGVKVWLRQLGGVLGEPPRTAGRRPALPGVLALFALTFPLQAAEPIPIKVVVVTMFEIGADTGDKAAEFQLWKEREKLDRHFPLPQAYHDVYLNDDGVLGMVTGMGIANAAASVMALGLDSRFDLTKAYWLVAGIAGIDPADGSIGSAAWAGYLVDGDLGHEIDAREIPKDWPNGYFARGTFKPGVKPAKPTDNSVYALNLKLRDWAYELTKDVALPDSETMKTGRMRYTATPKAQLPPFVLKGDHLAASTFWHGRLLNEWANQWVKMWTDGKADYVTTAMEDTATLQSLTYLARAKKVDLNRVLVLRTASNYDSPPPGVTAAENMAAEGDHKYSGFDESVESAYRVGSKVVHEIVKNWSQYEKTLPE